MGNISFDNGLILAFHAVDTPAVHVREIALLVLGVGLVGVLVLPAVTLLVPFHIVRPEALGETGEGVVPPQVGALALKGRALTIVAVSRAIFAGQSILEEEVVRALPGLPGAVLLEVALPAALPAHRSHLPDLTVITARARRAFSISGKPAGEPIAAGAGRVPTTVAILPLVHHAVPALTSSSGHLAGSIK